MKDKEFVKFVDEAHTAVMHGELTEFQFFIAVGSMLSARKPLTKEDIACAKRIESRIPKDHPYWKQK